MNKPNDDNTAAEGDVLESARRDKLERIRKLGFDPWGSRFDDHMPIGEIRSREGEIVVQPLREGQRSADQEGPKVRAAGRILLQRKKGKLIFADIQD